VTNSGVTPAAAKVAGRQIAGKNIPPSLLSQNSTTESAAVLLRTRTVPGSDIDFEIVWLTVFWST
jgi:hypothetical protein